MNKYIALLLPFLLNAQSITFSIDDNLSLETLRESVPPTLIVGDEEVQKSFNKELFFAKNFLKDAKEKDLQSAKLNLINFFYKKEVQKLFEKEKINITEDISYSYYLDNKNKYTIPALIDYTILVFKTEEDAKNFTLEQNNKIKPESRIRNSKFIQSELPRSFSLALMNLKPYSLSEIFTYNDKITRLYYISKIDAKAQDYQDVKAQIENYLFSLKRKEILNKILENK